MHRVVNISQNMENMHVNNHMTSNENRTAGYNKFCVMGKTWGTGEYLKSVKVGK